MKGLALVPIGLQWLALAVDELRYHRRRDLPRFERIGHPLDTLTIIACLGWLVLAPRHGALPVYALLAIGSTLFVTKDEAVHARLCCPGEHWLHAVLFALHPIVLAASGVLWWLGRVDLVAAQLAITVGFFTYQVVYWNFVRAPRRAAAVNNAYYAGLDADRWYEARDTPLALLRAEARHRTPWIARALGDPPKRVLDVGCGAGLLANDLAARGHRVVGLDNTAETLAAARTRDATGTVEYELGDACTLPYPDASFDAVCALDLLEHVEQPDRVIGEAARVLAPGGLLFFHTFNRTRLAHLIVIKGVEWFVRNTPPDLHVLRLFLTPEEVTSMCRDHGLDVVALHGSRPRFRWPLWRMLVTGEVGEDFAFTFTRSLRLGYTGYARKR